MAVFAATESRSMTVLCVCVCCVEGDFGHRQEAPRVPGSLCLRQQCRDRSVCGQVALVAKGHRLSLRGIVGKLTDPAIFC